MDQVNRPSSPKLPNRQSSSRQFVSRKTDRTTGAPEQGLDAADGGPTPDAAAFRSILFIRPEVYPNAESAAESECFGDLNLDQFVGSVVADRQGYDLKGYFHTNLVSVDDVAYRHEIVTDLEQAELVEFLRTFAKGMRDMREQLAQAEKLRFRPQKESWFLDAADAYCRCVAALADGLDGMDLQSRGMTAFRAYLRGYVEADRLSALQETIRKLQQDIAGIRYCIYIDGGTFKVHRYRDEADYGAEIEKTFAKFRQGDAKDYSAKLQDWIEMNHVEEKILEFVRLLWPEVFARLAGFYKREKDAFLDAKVAGFDRQIQFYLSYLDHIAPLKETGLIFSLPVVSSDDKSVQARNAFDIALADKLVAADTPIVCNDFSLSGKERILVVSGPNQGGKTTFSRTFGQMHFLASLGLPVPGEDVRLFLFDAIFTHFEREEDITNLRGKLQDDLVRVHEILDHVTPRSIVITNEIFTSTTLQDATLLSEKVMRRVIELDLICVWVTFIHELSMFSDTTVSMVSMVDPSDPNTRTYKVIRKAASGRSYAMSIAEKYGLTEERLQERIRP